MLATGSGKTAQLWEVATGKEIADLGGGSAKSISFSADGTLAISGVARFELWPVGQRLIDLA
jgi:hypothetical protein